MFDLSRKAYGAVFQATAHPEACPFEKGRAEATQRIEVTELFVAAAAPTAVSKDLSQLNITVTNCGNDWGAYSLWVIRIPPAGRPSIGKMGTEESA